MKTVDDVRGLFPPDMDEECMLLSAALSDLPGIESISSCCGHGRYPYSVTFEAQSLDALRPVCYYVDEFRAPAWLITAHTDGSMMPVRFSVVGPFGNAAYKESEAIAEELWNWIERAEQLGTPVPSTSCDQEDDGA